MKKIDTIVQDIYQIFSLNPIDIDQKEFDKHVDNFGEKIKKHLKEFLNEKPRENNNLRLSSIGKPDRQLLYNFNSKKEIKDISSSTRIKFLYGYILEELLLTCAAIAGHKVEHEQKEVEVGGVVGHQDAIIDDMLIDCKSTSGSSFSKFKKHNLLNEDPFGYIGQISAYAEANNKNEAAFLVIDKSSGQICLDVYNSLELINASHRIEHLKKIVSDSKVPDRCYDAIPDGKSGNMKLPIGCIYCPHNKECWQDANNGQGIRVFDYARSKRYLVSVYKEPDVPEVTDW